MPAYFNNARYEEICYKGIKLPYDGSKEELMPFLTRLDIWRQDEGWAPAMFVDVEGKSMT